MKKRYIIFIVLIFAVAALVFYRITKNKKEGAEGGPGRSSAGKDAPAMRVEGIIVKPQQFSDGLTVSGSVEANEQVELRSEVSGLVRSLNFEEGSNVSKGQILVRIDDSELKAQLSQALTKEQLASETENRANLLLKKEAISREEYDTALADLRSLKSQTQLIRAQIAKTVIRAPFSGKIGLRSISSGGYITPTTIVANLLSTNPVKIQFAVPEKYANRLKLNSALSFTVSGSNKKYSAKIYAIEPGINATTRTLQLRAKADNPTGELLPGSFAKINLPLATIENAILIPTQAIVPVFNGKKVFLSDSGKVKEVMVETSARTDKNILVTSGLKEGDTVLTTGVMALKAKAPVKVKIAKAEKSKL